MIRPLINFKKEWILRLATLAQNDTAGAVSRKVGIPLGETLGESENLACDGNFTPLLILFPKIAFLGNVVS